MQTRFHILLIHTLSASKANSPIECDHYSIAMEINASSSIWDMNCASLVFRLCFHLTLAWRGSEEMGFDILWTSGLEILPTHPPSYI